MSDNKLRDIGLLTGSGGGSDPDPPKPYIPKESENTLHSKATYRVIDVVSHGEIEGLVDGEKSIYIDGTPIAHDNGYNFEGIQVESRKGALGQSPVTGYPEIETPKTGTSVGLPTELKGGVAQHRTIQAAVADQLSAIRIHIGVSAMYHRKKNGDTVGSSVDFEIHIDGLPVKQVTIKGKCTSPYQAAYRIPITPTGAPMTISVIRTTADANEVVVGGVKTVNAIDWVGWDEIIDHKFEYPNTAYFAGTVDAETFGNKVPVRSYDIKGIKVLVPDGYVPPYQDANGDWVAAVYPTEWDGTWNGENSGSIIKVWTSNPAWIFYDLITNTEYGAGIKDVGNKLKWSLYPIAAYCDELIDDGLGQGGVEPRFQVNCVINTLSSAYSLISQLSNTFMGMTWWAANSIDVSMDAPADPQILATPANVIGGSFAYEGTDRKIRPTVVLVTWNDPANDFKPVIEAVEDADAIALHGYVKSDIAPFGCTSQGQAHRAGKWLLHTEQFETETVTYQAGLDHAFVTPGMLVAVADPFVVDTVKASNPDEVEQARTGGRLVSASGTTVVVDQDLQLNVAYTYSMFCVLPDGSVENKGVVSWVDGSNTQVILDSAFSSDPDVGAIWVITGTDKESHRLFRVLSKTENTGDDGAVSYTIVALLHDKYKYGNVEQGLDLTPPDYGPNPTTGPVLPPNNVTARVGTRYVDGILRNMVTVSWEASIDERVGSYRVRYKFDDTNWVYGPVTDSFTYEVYELQEGAYIFEVFAISRIGGSESIGVQVTLTLSELVMPDVTGLKLVNTAFTSEGAPILDQYTSGDAEFIWDRTNLRSSYTIWTAGTYNPQDRVSHLGDLWRALVTTSEVPSHLVPTDWEYVGVESQAISEDLWFDSYYIVIDPTGINRTYVTKNNTFTYTREMNAADHGGTPVRDFVIEVYQQGSMSQLSLNPASLLVSNPAPSMAGFVPTISGSFKGLAISWENWVNNDTDFNSFKIYCDTATDPPEILVQELMKGSRRTLIPDLVAEATYYVRIVPTDEFGDGIPSGVDSGVPLVLTAVDANLELTQSVTITDFSSDNHSDTLLLNLYDKNTGPPHTKVPYTIAGGGEWIRYAFEIETYIDKVIIYTADPNAQVYVRYSSDDVVWEYLKATITHTPGANGNLYVASSEADASTNYWQLGTGLNVASFPQNKTAKYCELCFVGTYFTEFYELMFVREVIAEQVAADNLSAISANLGTVYSDNYDATPGFEQGFMLDGFGGTANFYDMTMRVTSWGDVTSEAGDAPAPNATANAQDATLLDRSNHAGTIPYTDVWGGPPAEATANSPDAVLLERANHIGNMDYTSVVNGPPVDAAETAEWLKIAQRPLYYRVVANGSASTYVTPSGILDETDTSITTSVHSSYSLSVFSRVTNTWVSHASYDVYGNGALGGTAAGLASVLNGLTSDYIVVIFTDGEPYTNRLTSSLPEAIYRCGGSRTVFEGGSFQVGGAYILIGVGGIGEGNGLELFAGNVPNDVDSWLDTLLVIQNGMVQLGGVSAKSALDISYSDGTSVEDLQPAEAGSTLGADWATNVIGGPEALASGMSTATANAVADAKDYVDNNFVDAVTYGIEMAEIQSQLDGSIEVWFYDGVPSALTEPEVNWTDDTIRNQHLGGQYFDKLTGIAYRYLYDTSYAWVEIADSNATAALALAQNAFDLADNKRRVFVDTPIVPYDVGDLWDDSSGPDRQLRRCITAKTDIQAYSALDWVLVSDITSENTAYDTINVNGVPASTIQSDAQSAASAVADMASDGILSPAEKATWRVNWPGMESNYLGILSQATDFGLETDPVIIDLITARNDLYAYLHVTLEIETAPTVNAFIVPSTQLSGYVTIFYTAMQDAANLIYTISQESLSLPTDEYLEAYWSFDATVVDNTGGGRDITTNLPIVYTQGASGASFLCDGSMWGTFSPIIDLLDDTEWTISFWYRKDTAADTMSIGRYGNTEGQLYHMSPSTAGSFLRVVPNTGAGSYIDLTIGKSVVDGKFHHIAIITTASSMTLVHDGVVTASENMTSINTRLVIDCIGNPYSGVFNVFDGAIDEVRVYTTALTTDQAYSLYAMPSGGSSNVIGWDSVTGPGRPEDNATVGATWGVDINGQPMSIIQTFYQSTAPTSGMVSGDFWVDSTTNTVHRYNGSTWDSVQDNGIQQAILGASNAQATADGKVVTFVQSSPPTADGVGDIWFDLNDGYKMYRWSGSAWEDVHDTSIDQALVNASNAINAASTAQGTADGKVTTFYQGTEPIAEGVGDLWIDTANNNELFRWNGTLWVPVQDAGIAQAINNASTAQATADGKIVSFYQAITPTASGVGDLWVDTDDGNRLYRWSGTLWNPIRDVGIDQALSDAAQAISDAAQAQGTADGKVTTFYQTTPPTADGVGDLWIDTDNGNALSRWNGTVWESVQDTGIAQAINNASTAQATADGKINSYFQDSQPTGNLAVGDLWIQTNVNNRLHRYTGTMWVLVRDAGIQQALTAASNAQATADGKIVSFYQSTEPTAGMSVGDIWIDTDDGNKLYRYSGTLWVDIQDGSVTQAQQDAADALVAAGNAVAAADGKIVTFAQATMPAAEGVGDLWMDTDDSNKLYRWDGAVWVDYAQDYADWQNVFGVGRPDDNADQTQNAIQNGTTITGGYISCNDTAGINGAGTAPGEVRFWAGTSYANRANANFRVSQDGTVVIQSASTGARMVSENDRIVVYDENNIVRVKLGNLA